MDRRGFLKTLSVTGASALTAGPLTSCETANRDSGSESPEGKDPVGVLVDTTRCGGCRYCEKVCAEANGLPIPDVQDQSGSERGLTDTRWSVVDEYATKTGPVFVKKQCMHCVDPACASACLTKAMLKTENGPVIWRASKCMGCRFCMISCPFDIPKFEYDSPVPDIQKCILCWQRLEEGEKPACVENCPAMALQFGKRSELIEEARARIQKEPDRYVHHIYGEHEAGGTGWLYLSAVPFEELGFRADIGTGSYPGLTRGFLYSVPLVLTLWPPFLLALSKALSGNARTDETGNGQQETDSRGHDGRSEEVRGLSAQ